MLRLNPYNGYVDSEPADVKILPIDSVHVCLTDTQV